MHRAARLITLFGILFTIASLPAKADTIDTFLLSGDFPPFASILGKPTGTVTIDTTTGVIGSINLSYTNFNPSGLLPGNNPFQEPLGFGNAWYQNDSGEELYASEEILLPVSSLVGYAGGPICSDANPCAKGESRVTYLIIARNFVDGQLTLTNVQVTPTPEPASLLYLATAALGPVAFRMRQLARLSRAQSHA